MRIAEHMRITHDNKIWPELAAELGFEYFWGWYSPVAQRNHECIDSTNKELMKKLDELQVQYQDSDSLRQVMLEEDLARFQ